LRRKVPDWTISFATDGFPHGRAARAFAESGLLGFLAVT
jgi:hypothetical protein